MPSHRSHLLCMTMTPISAEIVEAKRASQGIQVVRRSSLVFAKGADLDAPEKLGTALSAHLKENGYGTKHVVIGLCPRWVLARHKQVPPADTDALRGIVNLQIEREFASSAADMSFDYLLDETQDSSGQTSLLLVGVRKAILDRIKQLADAAGLRLEGVSATSLSVASSVETGTAVLIESGVAGVLRLQGGSVLGLVSCSADASCLSDESVRQRLLADLSRCSMQLPSSDAEGGLILILPTLVSEQDAATLAAEAADRFGDIQVRQIDASELLARHTLCADGPQIDFNTSRLAAPKRSRLSPTAQWLIRAAVVVLFVGLTVGYLWYDATSKRDALQEDYDLIQAKAQELEQIRVDTRQAEAWFDRRPPVLDAMLELTKTFPTQGQIRVETLAMQGDLDCQIECTAEDRQTMDRYFRQMQQSSNLVQVNRGSVRPAGGNSTWIDFPVTCRFAPDAQEGLR